MKVRSQPNFKHDRKRSVVRVFFIALLLIGLGLLLPTLYTAVGRVVMYPIQTTQQWFRESQARLPMFIKDRNVLVDRVKDLESKLAAAEGTDLTQQRLYEENLWLRDLLTIDQRARIGAAVIARPNELPYDFMQIDRGDADGIKLGAPVYIGADNVIGVVSQVATHYAFVELFTTPGFTTTAFISDANVVATLEGRGAGVARVAVPQGVPIKVGNLVHVPSIEPGVFGRIDYIENEPTQPEQYGYVTLRKPITSINYVAVGAETLEPVPPEMLEGRISDIIRETLLFDVTKLNLASTTIIGTSSATSVPATTP